MEQKENSRANDERRWTSRSIGSDFQHRIFYVLIRLGGRRAAYFLLHFVVLYYVIFCPSVRRKTGYYLRRRFPERTPWQRLFDSYRMSLELGKVLLDRAVVGILGPGQMNVSLHGRKELLELLDEGKGMILMTSHVGCWQVAMSALGFLDTRVSMLMRREDGDVDRHYFEHSGTECPYNVIDPSGYLGGALEMLGVLKNGEVLSVMGDRVLGSDRSVAETDFLGAKVWFPFSAFKLASATGAPVVVFFSYKTGPSSYELKLARVIRVPEGMGRKADNFKPYVAQFAEALEEYTKEYPYQFFNFYDMWHKDGQG